MKTLTGNFPKDWEVKTIQNERQVANTVKVVKK